jgi:L-lactate dehydrogenase (cytochrome)/(S)-mandelate dehydrogenase
MFLGHNAFEYRDRARRMLPSGLFQFIDRGTEDELGLAENRRQLEAVKLTRRVLRDVSGRSTATELFGKPLAMPVAIAPTGAAGLLWNNGELALAKAAQAAGIPFTLATGSLTAMERIATEAGGNLWFQLYILPDKAISHALIGRVMDAGFDALVVTVDMPVAANREYNLKSGFTIPFKLTRRNMADVITHPGWCTRVLGRYLVTTGLPRYENYPTAIKQRFTAAPMGRSMPKSDSLTWADLGDIRRMWPKTLLVKGILHPEDAELAIAQGVDGIIVSNHGGRSLDSVITPIQALPAVVRQVAGRVPVLVDSGFMRGSDVVKALALGARCVLVGRATLYGVAVGGEAGAARVLSLLKDEIARTMAMVGCASVEELDESCLAEPVARPAPAAPALLRQA